MREGITARYSFRDMLMDLSLLLMFMVLAIMPAVMMKVPANTLGAQATNTSHNKPVVFLPEQPIRHASHHAIRENIYAWIQLKNPFLGLLPDCQYGFKQFLDMTRSRGFGSAYDESALSPPQAANAPLQQLKKSALAKDDGSILLEPLMGINVTMPSRPQMEEANGIFWMDDRGRILQNPPEINLADARRAQAAGPQDMVIRNTVLQVLPSAMPDAPPRIIVRQSSGNSELDRQGVSALRRRILQSTLELGNAFMPADGVFLEIMWKLFR